MIVEKRRIEEITFRDDFAFKLLPELLHFQYFQYTTLNSEPITLNSNFVTEFRPANHTTPKT